METILRSRAQHPRRTDPFLTSPLARLTEILLVGAAYYVSGRLGLRLSLVQRNVTPLWPPSGIALVAFLLLGRRVWPGVAVAAFMVNEPISATLLAALVTAAGNTLAPFVAAELLRAVGFHTRLDRVRDAISIVILAALAGMLLSASIGTTALLLSHAIRRSAFLNTWAVWWTGDAMGILVVAPFLLSLAYVPRHPKVRWTRAVEAIILFVVLAGLSLLGLAVKTASLKFLVFPILGWAAWRFQQRGAAPAALLVAGVATWGAAHGWGSFAGATLLQKMLALQAFNATVAFSSFFFAALVTERMQAREALERSAADLEDRIRRRTWQLSEANELLVREIAERKETDRRLRQQERQLAEAQQLARVGSWEWVVEGGTVTWSDEMYRIHGFRPQEFTVTFEKAMALLAPEDASRIRENLARTIELDSDSDLRQVEYRIRRPDGEERILSGKARLTVAPARRLVGTVQDVTEEKQAERQHRIAETLQRSLLPEDLPEVPGVALTARYVPATGDMEVGGDWYDVVSLSDGQVGVAIGDVVGHGLQAATTMGQLRMALRAYALEETSPAAVARRMAHLIDRLMPSEMATLIYLVFDPVSGRVVFVNAGHPPPLQLDRDGSARFLRGEVALPLGAFREGRPFPESEATLEAGSTLVLFTDGLVERRGASIDQGLATLRAEAVRAAGADLGDLCDHLLSSLVGVETEDDVALLGLRAAPLSARPLHLRLPAEPQVLAPLRQTLRRFLREVQASEPAISDVLVACGEACANVIVHAYGAGSGFLELDLVVHDGVMEVAVRDWGAWRPPDAGTGAGRGLLLMRALMDSAEVEPGPRGTVVHMTRQLRAGVDGATGAR